MNKHNNWEQTKLENIAIKIIGGGTPSTSKAEYWNGEIAWTTSAHLTGREIQSGQKYITQKGLSESSTNIVPRQNILVATRVGIGKVAINKIDIAISQDLTGVLVDKEKVMPEYLYWALIRKKNKLKALAQGSTIKGILRTDVAKIQILLPPLPEQKKIAEILSTVDLTIEKADVAIKKIEKIKKGIFLSLLLKNAKTENWEFLKIEKIVKDKKGAIKIGPFGSQLKKGEMVPFGIKVYGQENVINDDFSIGKRYITTEKFQKLKTVELFPDDVLITMMGSLGYSTIFPRKSEKGIMDSHLIRIQMDQSKCLPKYLTKLINDSNIVKNQIKKMSQGAIMSGLNSQIVRRIKIPLPSINNQQIIVDTITIMNNELAIRKKIRTKLEGIKKGLMNDLLTGQKRVRVDS